MVDTLTPVQRSERMSRIRGKDTRPELLLRRAVHRLGLRYRLHPKELPGRPDLVFPKYRAVVFVHGCFWHRHPGCSIATTPKSNVDFWRAKFEANVARDQRNVASLELLGWRVFTVWECETNTAAKAAATATSLSQSLRGLATVQT